MLVVVLVVVVVACNSNPIKTENKSDKIDKIKKQQEKVLHLIRLTK